MSRKTRKHTLSVQQEAFAQAVAVERMLFAEAYKLAYNVKESTPQKTINEGGSRVANNPWVAARIEELRKQLGKKLEAKTLWTFEHSVAALKKAYSEGNPSVKVSAIKELNAMHGYNAPTKLDVTGEVGVRLLKEQDKSIFERVMGVTK